MNVMTLPSGIVAEKCAASWDRCFRPPLTVTSTSVLRPWMNKLKVGFLAFISRLHPVRLVALGYLSYCLIGWGILSLPVCHETEAVSSLDALFSSTSAVSTTGLVTISVGNDLNFFGQFVLLVLMQLGGIGYMTFGSFVVLSRSESLPARRQQVGKIVFNLPVEFRLDKFIRSVIYFTLVVEAIGAITLYFAFVDAGLPQPIWSAIFHSVSAFCTAGLSLYDDSFEQCRGNVAVNATLGCLSYLGAIGFIVFVDGVRCLFSRARRLTLTSRVILVTTGWLSLGGVLLFFIQEPTIQHEPPAARLLTSCFQVMTSITTVGFNTVPIGELSQASLFLIILLMLIGASPSGTGGGLKTTTFTALFGIVRAAAMGRKNVTFWNRDIPNARLRHAMANLGVYAMALITGCYLLALTESTTFEALLFEAASALGTVGLSTGITTELTPLGQLILIWLMFVGRLGPLVFGIAIFLPPHREGPERQEDLVV